MNLFLTSVSSGISNIKYLKDKINRHTKLVVLPFAHHFNYISQAQDVYNHYDRNPKNEQSIYWRTVRPFIDIGINPDNIVVINAYVDPIGLIKQKLLSDNTIVYLPGGFPENIVKILKKLKLTGIIKQCKIVVGESAGSMFWSKRYFVYPDTDYPKYKSFKGIGMINDFVVIPHYDPDNKEMTEGMLKACFRFNIFHRKDIYALKDGGWIWYDSETGKIKDMYKTSIYRCKRNL